MLVFLLDAGHLFCMMDKKSRTVVHCSIASHGMVLRQNEDHCKITCLPEVMRKKLVIILRKLQSSLLEVAVNSG